MNKKDTYPGQPKGLPHIIKLKINNVPVIINYEKNCVTTPKKGGESCGSMVMNYLITEGFIEASMGGNNGEEEDDLVY